MEKIKRYAADTPKSYRAVAILVENKPDSATFTNDINMKFIFGSWVNPINLVEFLNQYGNHNYQQSLNTSLTQ